MDALQSFSSTKMAAAMQRYISTLEIYHNDDKSGMDAVGNRMNSQVERYHGSGMNARRNRTHLQADLVLWSGHGCCWKSDAPLPCFGHNCFGRIGRARSWAFSYGTGMEALGNQICSPLNLFVAFWFGYGCF